MVLMPGAGYEGVTRFVLDDDQLRPQRVSAAGWRGRSDLLKRWRHCYRKSADASDRFA